MDVFPDRRHRFRAALPEPWHIAAVPVRGGWRECLSEGS